MRYPLVHKNYKKYIFLIDILVVKCVWHGIRKLTCPAGDLNQNVNKPGIIDEIMNHSEKEQPVTLLLLYFE